MVEIIGGPNRDRTETSSMPWCLQNDKLLTDKQLEAVEIGKTGPIGGL